MFFGPRAAGSAATPKTVTMGIGVILREEPASAGGTSCSVTLEAISTDASCPLVEPPDCGTAVTRTTEPPQLRNDAPSQNTYGACGLSSLLCEMTPAPAMDKTVDELASHMRDGLGPDARVSTRPN
jgi:hypothetical protein